MEKSQKLVECTKTIWWKLWSHDTNVSFIISIISIFKMKNYYTHIIIGAYLSCLVSSELSSFSNCWMWSVLFRTLKYILISYISFGRTFTHLKAKIILRVIEENSCLLGFPMQYNLVQYSVYYKYTIYMQYMD